MHRLHHYSLCRQMRYSRTKLFSSIKGILLMMTYLSKSRRIRSGKEEEEDHGQDVRVIGEEGSDEINKSLNE